MLLAAIAYYQINEVYPSTLAGHSQYRTALTDTAVTLFPSPLPKKVEDHAFYPALVTAVRDLANDNVITAVMLTGVMLLQVRLHLLAPSTG